MPRERRAPPSEIAPLAVDDDCTQAGMDARTAVRNLAKILACQAAQEDDAAEDHGPRIDEQNRAVSANQ